MTVQSKFNVDRTPVRVINLYGANYSKTPNGNSPVWYQPSGVDWLIDRIEEHYSAGWRKFMIHLPAGSILGQNLMPSAQWHPMPDFLKNSLITKFKPYLKSKTNIKVGLYSGFNIHDAFSLSMPESGDKVIRKPDPAKEEDVQWMKDSLSNWLDIGLKFFMWDWSSGEENSPYAVAWSRLFSIFGIKVGGEAFPTRKNGASWDLGPEVLECPWLALSRFILARDPASVWPIDTSTMELWCGIRAGEDTITFGQAKMLIDRGYIPCVYNSSYESDILSYSKDFNARLASDGIAVDI